MLKEGSKNKPCTWCDCDALPDTWPPACERHLELTKTASASPTTLKELEVAPPKVDNAEHGNTNA